MELDYNSEKGLFFIRVPSEDPVVRRLMIDHGMDLSLSASKAGESVLFTPEPFCAATFFDIATDKAKLALDPLQQEIAASWASENDGHYDVPEDKELWPFQKADLAYALRRDNVLIADQPGLGKTEVAIAYANETRAKRVLVICPASIRLQWVQRIREWSTLAWPFVVHPILNARNGVHPTAQWTVVSYELARTESIHNALMAGRYDLLILDEAHYLKSVVARRTRAVFGKLSETPEGALQARCGHTMALTGTPLPNRPREAYTLARNLNWDCIDWMSEETFNERFNPILEREVIRRDGRSMTIRDERSGRHAELQNRLRFGFMSRHLKRDVMTQLRMPVYDLIELDETSAGVKQALHAESMLHIDPENLEGADAQVMGDIATVRRMMGLAMAPQVADWVEMLLEGGEEKIVLFGWHTQVLDIYQARLLHRGVVRVDGSTSAVAKQKMVDRFINDPECQVIVGNLLSLGTGTDGLQHVSNHALIGEPDWVAGNNIQAFDRLDRGGQTRQVQGDIFVVPGSFAEKVLASALRKLRTTHKALDQKGTEKWLTGDL